jgi:FkbM family methyltransferase
VRISSHERLMSRLLRPGDHVIDVGANVGYFSAVCAKLVGEQGAVHSIEASPILFQRLRGCVEENPGGPIRLHHFAVWNTSTVIPFNIATVSGWSSLKQNPTFQTDRVVEVQAITLDEFVQGEALDHARVIKMDIEGAEVDALLGARNILRQQRADFFLLEAETNRLRAFGHRGEDIADIMARNGYEPVCIIASDHIGPVTKARSIPGYFNGDFLYVRQDLLADARKRIF